MNEYTLITIFKEGIQRGHLIEIMLSHGVRGPLRALSLLRQLQGDKSVAK